MNPDYVFTQEQEKFIRQRQIMIRSWPFIWPILIVCVVLLVGFLYFTAPMFISPFAVMERLEADTLDLTTLQTMAIMLPVVFCLLCMVVVSLILIVSVTFSIEKKYQKLFFKNMSQT